MVRFSRREGLFLMLGASQAALFGAASATVTYDDLVALFDSDPLEPNVVSYWKFQNDGADERGRQAAGFTGTPEPNVETIVDLDRIAEGASEDGKCIAWPGTPGIYAEAAHHADHKTAQGTIVVTFQHDSLQQKSTLVAADRSAGGTSSGPGGLSLEVEPDGSPRCFLRRQSDGAPVILVGQAGDIQLNEAYTLIFKWGSAGMSLALWNASGTLVRRLTDPLGDGVTGESPIRFGAWHTDISHHDGPYGRVIWLNRRISDSEEQVLARARTVQRADVPTAGFGVPIPLFDYQSISDAVPGGAVWWDPTSGSDSNNGSSKGEAKKTFAAAEALASTSKRIILAGGAEGSTTYHVVGKIVPTKSGTGTNARMELFAEPNRKVVLVREGDFLGGIDGSWTWTQASASLNTWDSPHLGIGDGATTVSPGNPATGSNWLAGFIRIPNGCNDRPHLMKLPWVGTTEMNNTGGGNPDEGGYAGPSVCFLGNGKIRIRMQPPTQAVAGNEWPTDGSMGSLIGFNGTWQEPSGTPNNYEIHLVRWDGDFATNGAKDLFDFAANNVNWWHIKGVNSALINRTMKIGANTGIKFEKCTSYPHWCGVGRHSSSSSSVELIRCRHLTGDNRSMSWRAHKTAGYWFQRFRSAHLFDSANVGSGSTFTMSHCTVFGWFDEGLPSSNAGTITVDHCAILNNVDDAYQVHTDGSLQIIRTYSYVFGGPFRSTDGNNSDGSNVHWIEHHNIYYQPGIPVLWKPYGSSQSGVTGICPNLMYTQHASKGKARKMMYNTIICCADCGKGIGRGPMIATADAGTNVPSGAAHEVFNNLICLIATKRYPTPNSTGDSVVSRISCEASTAGVHRYDYNLYFRSLPGANASPFFLDVQNSRGSNRANYTSLANFRASAHKTTSESMYSDGTDGHEHHGVQENPQFVDLANRDFRPQSAGAISGAKNVTSIIGGSFENWKGALDPSGDGSEVGPQNP